MDRSKFPAWHCESRSGRQQAGLRDYLSATSLVPPDQKNKTKYEYAANHPLCLAFYHTPRLLLIVSSFFSSSSFALYSWNIPTEAAHNPHLRRRDGGLAPELWYSFRIIAYQHTTSPPRSPNKLLCTTKGGGENLSVCIGPFIMSDSAAFADIS